MSGPLRFLIADEALTVARRTRVHLQQAGVDADHILEALTAEEAMRFFEAKEPHVALVALELPDRPGHEVAQKMLAMDPRSHVILLTAAAGGDERVQEAIQYGIDAVLQKPIRGTDVAALLKTIGHERQDISRIPPSD